MDNGYREIIEDERAICQAGDQCKSHRDGQWESVTTIDHGQKYRPVDFRRQKFRRPIAQDEPKACATPTDKIVAHALDATANAPDTVIETEEDIQLQKFCAELHCLLEKFRVSIASRMFKPKNMTFSKIVFQRYENAETIEIDTGRSHITAHELSYYYKNENSVQLIPDVNDTNVVDMPESQWLPEVGEECMVRYLVEPDGGSPDLEKVRFKASFLGQVWFQDTANFEIVLPMNACEFRPIKTPEQIAAEERDFFVDKVSNMDSHSIYNWLMQSGVDLSRLTKKDKGDE